MNTGHTCVTGLGWGDEGKGKIVDLLSPDHDVIVRSNGGANAGHTVCIGDDTFILHLLPSGILHPDKVAVIGPGVVVDPLTLVEEIDALAATGIEVGDRLRLSDRAHVVMPYHRLEDRLSESSASQADQIGTTSRGIGPCYADKMRRSSAIRVCDLLRSSTLATRVTELVRAKETVLRATYGEDVCLDAKLIVADLSAAADRLRPTVCDTTAWLWERMEAGARVLFEAANGTLLDVDHGTYPFVTSSGTTTNGVSAGAGVPAQSITHFLGVTKAYATRVGRGPFVTELSDAIGDQIRERGHEYGSTTGRPRRCGWFDAVANRYSVRLGGITEIALMHLDTLTGFDRIGVCTGYRLDGQSWSTLPADIETLDRVEPVMEYFGGWTEDLSGIQSMDDLPKPATEFIHRIESCLGVPITIVSVGPRRVQTIIGGSRALSAGTVMEAPA